MIEVSQMSFHSGVAVWIDHHEARVYHVVHESFDVETVKAPQHHFHRHPKGPSEGHEHPDDMTHFFAEVAGALANAENILIAGPSTAKSQLVAYIHEHARAVEAHIVAVETMDHPTEAQFVAHVRHHFRIPDRVR
jgi:stalled ribosome rescue protein Dom34